MLGMRLPAISGDYALCIIPGGSIPKPREIQSFMRIWYCARTVPNEEWRAKRHLEQQGMTAFLPLYLKRYGSRNIRPLLLIRNYIFISLSDPGRWPLITRTIGISNLLTFQPDETQSEYKEPSSLGSEAIEGLRLQALSMDEVRKDGAVPRPPKLVITLGCHVRILRGPLTMFNVQEPIVDWSEQDRASLVLAMFGRDHRFEFYHKDLEVVSSAHA